MVRAGIQTVVDAGINRYIVGCKYVSMQYLCFKDVSELIDT